MDKKEQAIALRGQKYNCCQAVVCCFADEAGSCPDCIRCGVEVIEEVLGL